MYLLMCLNKLILYRRLARCFQYKIASYLLSEDIIDTVLVY